MAWQQHFGRMYERVRERGFEDVSAGQFNLFRWPGIDGMRPGEIAERLQLSKQTVNDVLGELESNGYVRRSVDPTDGRARIVHLTRRGWALQNAAHAASEALEEVWARSIGRRRFDAMRAGLEAMVGAGTTGDGAWGGDGAGGMRDARAKSSATEIGSGS